VADCDVQGNTDAILGQATVAFSDILSELAAAEA